MGKSTNAVNKYVNSQREMIEEINNNLKSVKLIRTNGYINIVLKDIRENLGNNKSNMKNPLLYKKYLRHIMHLIKEDLENIEDYLSNSYNLLQE